MFRIALFFTLSAPAFGALHENKIHGDAIWDTKSVVDESMRREIFEERHGSWPDPKWLEHEPPGYQARMEERSAAAMATQDSQQRWDEWMFLAQARLMPTFTERQYDVVKAPKAIHDKLLSRYHEMLPKVQLEGMGPGLSGVEGPNHAMFFPQEELNYEVLHELTDLFSEWAGVELEPTSVYGVRVYQNGSTLRDHLDVLETHVISGILHIDSDLDAPFPIQIEDASGVLRSADLKPGDLMFYESAKCYHQRKEPMQGRHYASIFMHYRPKGWSRSREEARYAIPPYWAEGLPRSDLSSSSISSTGEVDALSSDGDGTGNASGIEVTFANNFGEPVHLFWLQEGGVRLIQGELAAGEEMALGTHTGHTFIAVPERAGDQGNALQEWTMEKSHHKQRLLMDPTRPDANDAREL